MPRPATSLTFALLLLVSATSAAWSAPPDQPKTIKLAPAAAKPTQPLAYSLLPDPLDLKPGNAATYWRLACTAAKSVKQDLGPKEDAWINSEQTSLKDLPREEIRAYLDLHAKTLSLAAQAAHCERCDWKLPPYTVQTMEHYSLEEVQRCRQVAYVLRLKARLELSEGKFDDCLRTLQLGFTLARHAANGDTSLQSLIGVSIAGFLFGAVEEMTTVPGGPNLFWALTSLPSPFIDARRALQIELDIFPRSYPQLRDYQRPGVMKTLTVAEADHLFETMQAGWPIVGGEATAAWPGPLGFNLQLLKLYPAAKAQLLAQGYAAKEIGEYPVKQVIILYYVDQCNRFRDDVLHWLNAPPWQARRKLGELEQTALKSKPSGLGPPLTALLFSTTYGSSVRTNHLIARLRCAEALRLYADTHDGQAPAKFSDLGDLPLPLDPYTGKSFEEGYQFKDGQGTLTTPATSPLMKPLHRRYEIGK